MMTNVLHMMNLHHDELHASSSSVPWTAVVSAHGQASMGSKRPGMMMLEPQRGRFVVFLGGFHSWFMMVYDA